MWHCWQVQPHIRHGSSGYRLITDGEGLINAIIAVAVTNKFYEAHPEIIEKLQSAQAEIADFMQNHEAGSLRNGGERSWIWMWMP